MEYWKLYRAPKGSPKKWAVRVPSASGRGRTIKFGARGYQDYTQHKDQNRRHRYWQRHQNDNLDDPYSAGFWAWYVLWGDSTNVDTNFRKAVRLAKTLI